MVNLLYLLFLPVLSLRADFHLYPNLLQLAYCVVQFLEKESSLTEPVISPLGPLISDACLLLPGGFVSAVCGIGPCTSQGRALSLSHTPSSSR